MGGGSKAPAGYQPTWQAGADNNYQGLVQNATPWATSMPGATIPSAYQAAYNIGSNPYNSVAQTGANQVAANGSTYAGDMSGAAGSLSNLAGINSSLQPWQAAMLNETANLAQNTGQQAAGYGNTAVNVGNNVNQAGKVGYGETQSLIPSTTQGAAYANPMLAGALSMIPSTTAGMDAAQQVLNTGFDPQQALYDRTQQQTTDQQNAINSMYGLGSSAYGAGLAAQNAENFNIDWQNNQLSRETQALQSYGQQQANVANNYANLSNAGVNQYDSLTSNAVNNLDNLVNTGMSARATGAQAYQTGLGLGIQGQNTNLAALGQMANNYNSTVGNQVALNNSSINAQNAATQQQIDAQQMLLSSSQAPQLTYQNQQQAALAALASAAQAGNLSMNPTTGLGSMDAQYLQLGQGATRNAQNAAQINNASTAGLGQLIGSIAGMALAPATGGLSLFGMGAGAAGAGAAATSGLASAAML